MLLELNSDTFKVVEGRQEDAEECLTFLLNGLNDEMLISLKKSPETASRANSEDPDNAVGRLDDLSAAAEEAAADSNDESDDWKEVGPKKRTCITRRQNVVRTPVADMFQGQTRSCVFQHAAGEPTATHQPFFTLQLDIESSERGCRNVSEALLNNFGTEVLDGFVCSKTKKEIEASRNLSLEKLPPILVLHMKRFVYDKDSGRTQKLLKSIHFSVDLDIPREILSANMRNKYNARQRSYKLFAIVYHNGCEAAKGHYVTDIYHAGFSTWLRCDDGLIKPVPESIVLNHAKNSLPYLLLYRRGDTIGGMGPSQK